MRHGHVLAAVQSHLVIHGGMAQANIFDDLYLGGDYFSSKN